MTRKAHSLCTYSCRCVSFAHLFLSSLSASQLKKMIQSEKQKAKAGHADAVAGGDSDGSDGSDGEQQPEGSKANLLKKKALAEAAEREKKAKAKNGVWRKGV